MNAQQVLEFWFPADLGTDSDSVIQQVQWWFRGGSNEPVRSRFTRVLQEAEQGALDHWRHEPQSRLALILVLDQFSRAIYAQDPRAYQNDSYARDLAREGLALGHYEALSSCWEKTFYSLPFGHSEQLADAERAVQLAEQIAAEEVNEELKEILDFSAGQAKAHRDVIARFGRHPHRNSLLGRASTPDEQAYLDTGQLVHERPLPGQDG